jgi:hypothetical protein
MDDPRISRGFTKKAFLFQIFHIRNLLILTLNKKERFG